MKQYSPLIGTLVVCVIWILIEVKRHFNRKLQAEFMQYADEIEKNIMQGDRNNRHQGRAAKLHIENLENRCFNKATRRRAEELRQFWRAKFNHLYPI